jgi:transcriptional regulator with XRE-family HTH domain
MVPYERVEELLRQGMTQQQICQRLGINKSSVSQIATGKYRRLCDKHPKGAENARNR